MATWRPNEELYGPGGGDWIDDLGGSTPDPYGALRPMSAPLAMTDEQLAVSGPGAAPPAPGAPQSPGQVAMPPAPPAEAATAPRQGTTEPPDPAAVKEASANDSGMQPVAVPPQTTSTSDRTTSDSTTGLSAADRATQEAGVKNASALRGTANAAAVQQQSDAAALEQQRGAEGLASAAAAIKENADKIAVQEHILGQVDEKLKAGSDWRPDRQELFHGATGAVRGIAAAIAAMAGGWLMGQGLTGGKNPYLESIFDMINENVNDQVRKNSAVMQHLAATKGDVRAAIAELKQRQLGEAQHMLDAQARKDQGDLMQKGVAATKAQLAAKDAEWENDQRKALMQSVTHKVDQHFQRVTKSAPPGGVKLPRGLAVRYVQNNALQDEYRAARAAVVAAQRTGDAARYLGTVATHGVNWVQEHLNGLPPGQKKFANALMALERVNHINTGSSLVGLSADEKERYGREGIAEKERDIPTMLAHFDEISRLKAKENHDMLLGAGNEDTSGDASDDEPVTDSNE